MDAIEKEMKNMLRAFELNEEGKVPIQKKIDFKMIFNIKMMILTRKVCLVAGGHCADPQKESA